MTLPVAIPNKKIYDYICINPVFFSMSVCICHASSQLCKYVSTAKRVFLR